MELDHEQRLKTSLHYTVGKMCEEQEAKTEINVGKQMMATINEILMRQIKLVTQDLEAFARHGKRTTVILDDVKLLVRRNEDLKAKLSSNNVEETAAKTDNKGKALVKKRKSGAAPPEVHLDTDDDMFA